MSTLPLRLAPCLFDESLLNEAAAAALLAARHLLLLLLLLRPDVLQGFSMPVHA